MACRVAMVQASGTATRRARPRCARLDANVSRATGSRRAPRSGASPSLHRLSRRTPRTPRSRSQAAGRTCARARPAPRPPRGRLEGLAAPGAHELAGGQVRRDVFAHRRILGLGPRARQRRQGRLPADVSGRCRRSPLHGLPIASGAVRHLCTAGVVSGPFQPANGVSHCSTLSRRVRNAKVEGSIPFRSTI
jgi:hypothetical protein